MSDYTPNDVEIGFVEIYNHAGKKTDITKTFKKIEIEEDLFSSSLSGRITIVESADFHQNFPLIGEETIVIKFRTTDEMEWRELSFETFCDAGKTNVGELVAYVIEFVSSEYLMARSKRIGRPFVSIAPEKIVEDIIRNDLSSDKKIITSKSASAINFISTNIFPFELIASITSRARGSRFGDFGYMFWESIDGYHFESIDELISADPLVYTLSNRSGTVKASEMLQTINSHVVEEGFSILDRMTHGAFGTEVVLFDPLKRKQSIIKFDYFDDKDYEKLNSMAGNSPKKRVQTSNFKYKASQKRMVMPENGVKSEGRAVRIARLNWIESGYRMRVEIPGNSDMTVGKTIDLRWPSHSGEDMNVLLEDRYVSGKYLCTSMRHVITSDNSYVTNCVLTKDSLESSPEEESDLLNKRLGMI